MEGKDSYDNFAAKVAAKVNIPERHWYITFSGMPCPTSVPHPDPVPQELLDKVKPTVDIFTSRVTANPLLVFLVNKPQWRKPRAESVTLLPSLPSWSQRADC